MQAVRIAEQGTLSPKEQAHWLRVVFDLGARQQLLVVPKSVESGLQSNLVVEFLYHRWGVEEQARRRRNGWAEPLLIASVITWFLSTLGLDLLIFIIDMKKPYFVFVLALISMGSSLWMLVFLGRERQIQRGLAFLLTNGPQVTPCGLLIETLGFGGFGQDAKSRLIKELPRHHDTDVPAFDVHQDRILFSELKEGLTRRIKSRRSYFTDTDVAFLAVLIGWFEREATSGKPVPKEVMPILSRFVQAKPRTDSSICWRIVQTAAENYLLRVGVSTHR